MRRRSPAAESQSDSAGSRERSPAWSRLLLRRRAASPGLPCAAHDAARVRALVRPAAVSAPALEWLAVPPVQRFLLTRGRAGPSSGRSAPAGRAGATRCQARPPGSARGEEVAASDDRLLRDRGGLGARLHRVRVPIGNCACELEARVFVLTPITTSVSEFRSPWWTGSA